MTAGVARPGLGPWRTPAWAPVAQAASRASEHAVGGIGALSLAAFLLAQFLSLTRLFFSNRLGDGVTSYASQAGLLSVALLGPAVVAYGLQSGSLFGRLVPAARAWTLVVLVLATALFFYGWLGQGYVVTAVVHDLAPYLVIVASVILGSIPRVWHDTNRLLVALLAAALVVNAIGMTEITQVVSEAYAEDRAGTTTVAYRTQGALAFWPLFFLTARLRRPLTALLIFASVFFVLAQQVLFQKRSPSFRVALFMLVFLVLLPALRAHHGRSVPGLMGERRALLLFAGTGVLALCVALSVAPWLFRGQWAGLTQRLSGQAYQGGATAMLTTENERFFEAAVFLRGLSPGEVAFGRGFGGYFKPDASWWGIWLDDVGEFGRRQLHVGALMPFFKGGLLFALAYYAGPALALVRGARALRAPFVAAAFFVVLLHALFLLQEGWFIMSASFDLVMVGLSMGHLLSRDTGADRSLRFRPPLPLGVRP
jgi:hypothetical protein